MHGSFFSPFLNLYFLCFSMDYPWASVPQGVSASLWVSHRPGSSGVSLLLCRSLYWPQSLRGVSALTQVTHRLSSLGCAPTLGCSPSSSNREPPFKRMSLAYPQQHAFQRASPWTFSSVPSCFYSGTTSRASSLHESSHEPSHAVFCCLSLVYIALEGVQAAACCASMTGCSSPPDIHK